MKINLQIIVIAIGSVALGATSTWLLTQPSKTHDMTTMQHTMTPNSRAKPACRNNAFLDADKLIGAVLEIAKNLPTETSQATRQQLDFVLFISLKQAREEVHCVKNSLARGYDKTFSNTIRDGMNLAKMRGLSEDVLTIAKETLEALKVNK
jgi:hypothetical protein